MVSRSLGYPVTRLLLDYSLFLVVGFLAARLGLRPLSRPDDTIICYLLIFLIFDFLIVGCWLSLALPTDPIKPVQTRSNAQRGMLGMNRGGGRFVITFSGSGLA